MWLEFLITTLLAAGLLATELRRLASRYGLLLAVVAGGCAVAAVSVWLLVLALSATDTAGPLALFSLIQLLSTAVLPLAAFLYARRRFSIMPSLLPAAFVFAAVTFVFLNLGVGLAYSH